MNMSSDFTMLINANPLVFGLFAFIFLDIVSGLFSGGKEGKLSSTISFKGMMKKCQILAVTASSYLLQWLLERVAGQMWPLAGATSIFFIVTEFLSILENADRSGLPTPKFLSEILLNIREKSSEGITITASGPDAVTLSSPKGVTVAPRAEVVEVVNVNKVAPALAGTTTTTTVTTTDNNNKELEEKI